MGVRGIEVACTDVATLSQARLKPIVNNQIYFKFPKNN